MTTSYEKPHVFRPSLKQFVLAIVIGVPATYLLAVIKGLKIDFAILGWCAGGFAVFMYLSAPRIILGPDGLRARFGILPWISRIPWHEIASIGASRASLSISKKDGSSVNIWTAALIDHHAVIYRIQRWHEQYANRFCHQCDYNLDGNTSGQCPECGATVPRDAEPLRLDEVY